MSEQTGPEPELWGRLESAVVEAADYLKNRAADIRTVAGTLPGDENPHTNLDIEVDDFLKNRLDRAWGSTDLPAWLSEEKQPPPERLKSEYVFIIDPIDGTRNVIAGRPHACVSVALWKRGAGVLWACVVNPFTGETFTARAGQGALLNGNPIGVSDVEDVRHAIFLVSVHESVKGMLDRVKDMFKARPVGSIAYKMCLVAAGRGDATFTVNPRHDWDVAAAMLIVHEARGKVTDSRGDVVQMNSNDMKLDGVAVSNELLHQDVLRICNLARKALNLK